MNFQQRLSLLMEQRNLSAYKMASDLKEISEAMIGKWKKGKSLPSFDNIILLSNYLDVSTDYLLKGKKITANLTPEEQELLSRYRQCNDEGKNYIMYTANMAKIISPSAQDAPTRPKKVSELYDEAIGKHSPEKKVSERYDEATKGLRYVAAYGGGVHSVRNNKEKKEENSSD